MTNRLATIAMGPAVLCLALSATAAQAGRVHGTFSGSILAGGRDQLALFFNSGQYMGGSGGQTIPGGTPITGLFDFESEVTGWIANGGHAQAIHTSGEDRLRGWDSLGALNMTVTVNGRSLTLVMAPGYRNWVEFNFSFDGTDKAATYQTATTIFVANNNQGADIGAQYQYLALAFATAIGHQIYNRDALFEQSVAVGPGDILPSFTTGFPGGELDILNAWQTPQQSDTTFSWTLTSFTLDGGASSDVAEPLGTGVLALGALATVLYRGRRARSPSPTS